MPCYLTKSVYFSIHPISLHILHLPDLIDALLHPQRNRLNCNCNYKCAADCAGRQVPRTQDPESTTRPLCARLKDDCRIFQSHVNSPLWPCVSSTFPLTASMGIVFRAAKSQIANRKSQIGDREWDIEGPSTFSADCDTSLNNSQWRFHAAIDLSAPLNPSHVSRI